ncbi:PREDICTED: inositol hexakisphosphate and diphosphoinositol-pentakisphosphate kinase 1 isoform X1 [Lepidothrix coronata]|uniref:Inositol hexakisphosphate and diphosphoinositol-pentakisphosphate kinase n=1 Tax=Lepidothrix coronata TaxID=321398 RepID=A0A6J0IYC3_9PASS|nr:PREDICTED: inositol hexakisphosphate and diphosphoinositol-pentakisphosphate kinase 1 isoform X1 [Lepidothrix coronata]XP_017691673.1 PREDICTED: inositol hexakisphosphate and diphosphoinositol-pentakisphosphate kinase 1 isoform X1 [Lepidothrix coronata]XP_017691674.1 PREDICTED: inositol hexakisphosphate and diphosphoinositol-pentakisphosphate kinase 1 isoform X1 [Lepidothrix coronata]XP_017691675.1 PREDICTED: inositol hexakisphosphate and diphosphoinositol-pentakisphosphate kinase 1 isoform X
MSSLTTSSEGENSTPRFVVGSRDDETEFLGSNMKTDETDFFEDDEEEESPPERQIVVGICAMTKKSKSKPMTQILERLCKFEYITVVIMGEDVILNEPVENWPPCDCLISFHSKGFPLDKAVAYAKLCKPFLINDLDMQYYIQDRREVYRILQEEGIDLPRYAVLNRDPDRPEECNLVEGEDHVEVNGAVFPKPFVEKPVSAEDHNVYIYYPTSAGGGSQRLFRKIGSRSSVYSPESSVRKTGSYIYEEFMPTDGTDVKVYTVGPDYAHAEARKSPALDGKVERDSEGKEIRYPVMLTAMEKLVARKVCVAFKQTVCGFDLLRANGHSFVCDVNGFSFVKNSMKYYDDCAKILGNIIMRELAPQFHIPWSIPTEAEDIPIVPTTSGTMMELRCVIAVIRHGDRTPKQKMKMEVKHARFFELFEKYDGYKTGKLKLKKPEQLQEVLDIARQLVVELGSHSDCEIEERKSKLEQLKSVLEMYGHFSGINRKVQLTYLPHGHPKAASEDEEARRESSPSLLLVLKWGGELTPAGRVQAEELGRAFRCMYPGGQGDYAGFPGCGLLRLHSTYRHDLKIYASDEGRVQMTAAAFAKGLLALEGELTPILVQMVKSANMNGLLDSDSDSLSSCQHRVKARLHEIMQKDAQFCEEDYEKLAPTGSASLLNSMTFIQNPVEVCNQVFTLIENLTSQIRKRLEDPKSADLQLYHSETLELMLQRWTKLERDFRMKNGRYDISKIPDIYDCIKYDVQHNCALKLEGTAELFKLSKALADVIIPQEYGINKEEKLEIAIGFCLPLIKKIQLDLQRTHEDESVNKLHPLYSRGVLSPGRHVRTRLYFTSESHVHSLLSIFRYGGLLDENKDQQWKRAMDYLSAISELNYMTQIVIMLYEDNNKDPTSEERFHVELHFSPGVKGCEEDRNVPTGFGFRPASAENEDKKADQGSLEDLSKKGSDEPDRAQQKSPQPSEPVSIQRRSPLIRNRKTGSMEVLSESSSKSGGYRLFSTYSRQSSEMKQSGLGSQCTGLFSTNVLGGSSSAPNLQDYARSHGKKFASSLTYKDGKFQGPLFLKSLLLGAGRGLRSTSAESCPNLKLREELLSMPAVKRFSVSFAKHPTNDVLEHQHVAQLLRRFSSDCATSRTISLDATLAHHLQQCSYHLRLFRSWLISGQDDLECLYGFEGCSMVPTIYPLETLHNSLSLRQVNEFLTAVCRSCSESHVQSTAALFDSMIGSQIPGDPFMSQRILTSSSLPLRQRSDKPPWYSSGPSSTVSSAGPSSPTSVDNCAHFSFTEKLSISPPKSEEQLSRQSPEQEESQPPGRGLDMEGGRFGLSAAEPRVSETLTWNKGPEPGRLCKKELAEEDTNPEEKNMGELDEESSGEMLDPSNTGNPNCGAGSDLRLAGERVKPGEGCVGGMTGLDQSGLSKEILVPCEEELLGEVLDPEHMGKELLGDSALSDQLLSGHLCQVQALPPEKSMEELRLLCQEDQQN